MKKEFVYYIAALCIAFTGCSKEVQVDDSSTAVRFSTSTNLTLPVSKTKADNTFEKDDVMGVFVLNNGKSFGYEGAETTPPYTNVGYRCTGADQWNPLTDGIYLPKDGSAVDFYAYYPYSGIAESPVTITAPTINFTLKADQSTYAALTACDLMVATPVLNKTKVNPDVELEFNHLFSWIEFLVKKDNTWAAQDAPQLTKISISGKLQPTTTASIIDGSLGAYSGDPVTLFWQSETPKALTAAEADTSVSFILLPTEVADKELLFTFSIANVASNGGDFTYSVPARKFEKNTHYTYTVTIDKKGAIDLKASIAPWLDGGNTNIGVQ